MNLNNFISELEKKHTFRHFEQEGILNLLNPNLLEKDNPISQGKRLVVNRLRLNGLKNNGEIIDYDKYFQSGVNILFAQNGKGKSSVFKIIKFALTGDKSSIKKDVLEWLRKIFVEFSIGNTHYTVYIDLTKTRVHSGLYRCNIEDLTFNKNGDVIVQKLLIHFQATTETAFIDNMQQFFFEEFSYYLLLWTSSSKGNFNLTDNRTSWKTYYKSIYLESKDYNVLFLNNEFGSQNKKVLEMLLGLKYTAPINTWINKREHLNNRLRQLEYFDNGKVSISDDLSELSNELLSVEDEIKKIKNNNEAFKKTFDLKTYNQYSKDLLKLDKQAVKVDDELKQLKEDLTRNIKRINSLREEKEFSFFFSNLNIKKCPRCEHDIKSERKEIEKQTHKCMLCEEELDSVEDDGYLENKIMELEDNINEIKNVISKLKIEKNLLNEQQTDLLLKLKEREEKINDFKIEEIIIESLPKLIERKLELEIAITQKNSSNEMNNKEIYEEQETIYGFAIDYFKKKRLEESEDILNSLATIINKRVNDFGLENVTEVKINDSFEIIFVQNNIENKFSDLSEGEQLRAKLAVVLSLIVLDIQYNVGRHPRLLIIDSPGKEEVISEDLISLTDIFMEIEKEYGDKLQIIIGTALEEFTKASVDSKVDSIKARENVF